MRRPAQVASPKSQALIGAALFKEAYHPQGSWSAFDLDLPFLDLRVVPFEFCGWPLFGHQPGRRITATAVRAAKL